MVDLQIGQGDPYHPTKTNMRGGEAREYEGASESSLHQRLKKFTPILGV